MSQGLFGMTNPVSTKHGSGPAVRTQIDNSRDSWLYGYHKRLDDALTILSDRIRPNHLQFIGRCMIVSTFIEDAIRILSQWSDQLIYLHDYRSIPNGLTHLFLLVNVVVMLVASAYAVAQQGTKFAAIALGFIVLFQGLGYGLIFELNFFLRNMSVLGGLVMLHVEALAKENKRAFAGVPLLEDKDTKKYFQLIGRNLLILLSLDFAFVGQWTVFKVVRFVIGLAAASMVVIGFQAQLNAAILVVILFIFNILVNNFWSLHENHPQKDFAKYDFFQILSIVGGLLVLTVTGAGGVSVDERRKTQ